MALRAVSDLVGKIAFSPIVCVLDLSPILRDEAVDPLHFLRVFLVGEVSSYNVNDFVCSHVLSLAFAVQAKLYPEGC